mmetsp:Transcript_3234/g.5350  ORF Transcript_3234/g.5350 Transcript_3234/m.5350 type:complete len:239 (+) Transcript_3234:86-802(+)
MAGTVPLPQLMKALETAPPNSLIEHVHVTQFEKKNHLIEFIVTVEPFAHRGTHYTIGKRYEEFDQLKSHCSSIATFKSKFPTLKSFGAPSTKDLHARCHALDLWLRECLELSTSFPIVQRALFKFLEVHVNVDLGLGAGAAPTGGVPTSVRRASVGGAARRRSQQHKTLDFSALALGAAGGKWEHARLRKSFCSHETPAHPKAMSRQTSCLPQAALVCRRSLPRPRPRHRLRYRWALA